MIHGKTSHPLASFPHLSPTKRADEPDGKRWQKDWICWPCPPWSGSIAGLWRATAKLNHLRCVGFHRDMAEKLKIKNVVYLFELGFCEF